MTEASLTATPASEVQPKPPANSLFRHALYVVADNPVTGFSFALFVAIVTYSVWPRNKASFDEAAKMPLRED